MKINYSRLETEQPNRRSIGLDQLSSRQIVALMNREDHEVVKALSRAAKAIAHAADLLSVSFRRGGAKTILLTCNAKAVLPPVDVRIILNVGPEVLTGSTRLKSGTACKMALNMLTTASMVRSGKVYGHWMVDLQPKSKKLVARG